MHEREAFTVWQVKASTLCNLRCGYCYEWDRLSDRRRLSLDHWRRILRAVRSYHRLRAERHGITSRVVIVWHGGEPLLLPPAYVREVLALEREMLEEPASPVPYINGVQTNLACANDTLALMSAARFSISVSFDGVPGAREDVAGRATDARVIANLEWLRARSVACGIALVVGRHNQQDLPEIYDRLDGLGVAWLRVIPLFRPPPSAPGSGLELAPDEVVSALSRLFVHWIGQGARTPVQPFARLLRAIVRRRGGMPSELRDRRRFGETRLVVHPDGTLTAQAGTVSPASVLGNVFSDCAEAIFASASYAASLNRDDALRARHCSDCSHRGVCNTRAVIDHPHPLEPGPCPIEPALLTMVEAFTREMDLTRLRLN